MKAIVRRRDFSRFYMHIILLAGLMLTQYRCQSEIGTSLPIDSEKGVSLETSEAENPYLTDEDMADVNSLVNSSSSRALSGMLPYSGFYWDSGNLYCRHAVGLNGLNRYCVGECCDAQLFNFKYASISAASLNGMKLTGLNITGAKFTAISMIGADFSHTKTDSTPHFSFPPRLDVQNKNFNVANFSRANLYSVWFNNSSFVSTDFHGASIANSTFTFANLTDAFMRNSKFPGTTFKGTILKDVDLRGADLSFAMFSSGIRANELRKVDFSGADLRGTKLCVANAPASSYESCSNSERLVSLNDAIFTGAMWDCNTVFPSGFDPGYHQMVYASGAAVGGCAK